MKKHLPNAITILNLLSGCIAILSLFKGAVWTMALFVFLAAFFDLMDGMIARWLNVSSAIGKELDSLADMISFGLLPGLVMMTLLQESDLQKWTNGNVALSWLIYFPLLITAFSALRLAKFNIDTRQQSEFIGLPTPANTLSTRHTLFHCPPAGPPNR